jgi:YesN/AraC family two-component response regulator
LCFKFRIRIKIRSQVYEFFIQICTGKVNIGSSVIRQEIRQLIRREKHLDFFIIVASRNLLDIKLDLVTKFCFKAINHLTEKLSIEYVKNISILFSSLCLKLLPDPSELLAGDPGNKDNLYKQILESRTFEHLVEILKNIIEYTASGLKSNISRNSYLVKKALEYLKENYDKRVTLQDFADHIHVNGSYLSRIFSKETGETITEAVIRMKVDKARELLKDSRIKTYEVASLVGIEDPSYFSLIFKKHTGMSPKEYKNSSL